nr:hypothetical protein [Ferrimicrobium acidiphilum]
MTDYWEEATVTIDGLTPDFAKKVEELFNTLGKQNKSADSLCLVNVDVDDDGGMSVALGFDKGEYDDHSARGGKIDVYPMAAEFADVFGKKFVDMPGVKVYVPEKPKHVEYDAEFIGPRTGTISKNKLTNEYVVTQGCARVTKQSSASDTFGTHTYEGEYAILSDHPLYGTAVLVSDSGKRTMVEFLGGMVAQEDRKNAKDFWAPMAVPLFSNWRQWEKNAKSNLKSYKYLQVLSFQAKGNVGPGHYVVEQNLPTGTYRQQPDDEVGTFDLVAFAQADKNISLEYIWETTGAYPDLRDNQRITVKKGKVETFRRTERWERE